MPANLSFDNSYVFEGEVDLELGDEVILWYNVLSKLI